jgi:hypothetical protein
MALIPNKILTDEKISEFIDQTNANAKKIVGESGFIIPPPDLPGVGMLIKLWIRQSEKSFSSYFVPILLVKDVLNNPLEIPQKILGDVASFVNDPINELLNQTVNVETRDSLFIPIEILFKQPTSANFSNLDSLIIRADSEGLVENSESQKFPYVKGPNNSPPGNGEYSIDTEDLSSATFLSLSTKDYNGDSLENLLLPLIPGDIISLEFDGISQSWIIKSILKNNGYYTFSVEPQNESRLEIAESIEEKTVYAQVAQNSSTSGKNALRSLIVKPDGTINYPIVIGVSDLLKIVGVASSSGILNSIQIRIKDFNSLPEDSPIKKKVKDLEVKSGWNFDDILKNILNGKYPVLKYPKEGEKKTSKFKAREEILALAKLFDLLVNDTSAFFKILAGYAKLLLLPLQIVIGTLSSVFESVIQNPLSIFSLIVKLLTDPIGALGDLIAEAVLESIRPYIEPTLKLANISWEEAKEERINGDLTGKGLKPLVSDLIIGRFKCAGEESTGDSSIVSNISGPTGSSQQIDFTNYTYYFKYDGTVPQAGEVSLNSSDLNSVTSIKISSFDANVNSTLSSLVQLVPGSEISIPQENDTWVYVVNQKISPTGDLSYFVYEVSLIYGPDQNNSNTSFINSSNRAILSTGSNTSNVQFTTSDPFLQCLIDNYLPIKIIAVWESLKGIIGVVLGFVVTIPFLLKAVIESLFGSDPSFSNPAGFILKNLADQNTSDALRNKDVTDGKTLDFLMIRTSTSTQEFVDTLIGQNGIDVVLFEQSKKDPRLLVIKKEDGSTLPVTQFARNLKILLAIGKRYSEVGSLNGESINVTYYNGSTFEVITVKLTREDLNKYRITRGETTDNSNSDVIAFIRDNLFVAKNSIGG